MSAPPTTTAVTPNWDRRLLGGPSTAIWIATAVLFAISPIIAPGSLSGGSLLSMIPFAAVLAVIAVGQTLVVQQRGLDLSVPGMVSLACVLVTRLPAQGVSLTIAVLLAIAVPGLVGMVNGLIVMRFGVTSLVVTLAMNAALLGAVLSLSNGTPSGAVDTLNQFALSKTLGIPNTALVAIALVALLGVITQRSILGQRLVALGVSPKAARVVGIRVGSYEVSAYAIAGLCYGAAGVLLASYVKTPNLFVGDQYLLPSVAAVVLGGTALTGGLASVVASAVAAVFLTQLGQLLLAAGWTSAAQLIAQSLVLVAVVLFREIGLRLLQRRQRTRTAAAATPSMTVSGSA